MNSTQHQTRVDTQRQHVFRLQLHSIRLGRVVEIELEIQERSAKVSASHNKKANTVCCSSCPLSHWEFGMSTIQVKLAVVVLCVTLSMASTADAQRYRFLRSSPSVSKYSTPTYSARRPRPATGYGSNLHRNFIIRQEQQRWQRTGLPPRNRGNVLWAR